jgi:hypothetical protein
MKGRIGHQYQRSAVTEVAAQSVQNRALPTMYVNRCSCAALRTGGVAHPRPCVIAPDRAAAKYVRAYEPPCQRSRGNSKLRAG